MLQGLVESVQLTGWAEGWGSGRELKSAFLLSTVVAEILVHIIDSACQWLKGCPEPQRIKPKPFETALWTC